MKRRWCVCVCVSVTTHRLLQNGKGDGMWASVWKGSWKERKLSDVGERRAAGTAS